jgi:hypothetical protein
MKRFCLSILTLVFSLVLISELDATNHKYEKRVILPSRNCGLFSIFFDVLSLLECYEKGIYTGIVVNFGTKGLYYEKKYGPNWWTYYFEPIQIGNINNARILLLNDPNCPVSSWNFEMCAKKELAYDLIKKYVKLKPKIEEKINRFIKENFTSYMIGIHYRGTDKISEAPRVSYEEVVQSVYDLVSMLDVSDYKIFVATDEAGLITYLKSYFPNQLCFSDAIRSTNNTPVHEPKTHPYQAGKDAVVDCILLSKTDYLIRTSSNLSKASTYFNPHLPVIELSQRY